MSDETATGQAYAEATGSVPFSARLAVTDGGAPLELYEFDERATIERGEDNVVAEGDNLDQAWDCYLLGVTRAPVNDAELAVMWAEYDNKRVSGPQPAQETP
jgi:hypothetical protein